MIKQEFLDYCLNTYGTSPDYPFEKDFEMTVFETWISRTAEK